MKINDDQWWWQRNHRFYNIAHNQKLAIATASVPQLQSVNFAYEKVYIMYSFLQNLFESIRYSGSISFNGLMFKSEWV